MSGQEAVSPDPDVIARMDRLVASAAEAQRAIERHNAQLEEKIRPFVEETAKVVDPLTEARDKAMDELVKLMEQQLGSPGIDGKSLVLRSGTVAVRTTSATDIIDDKLLMKLARRLGVVKEVSEPQPRKLSKKLIAKLFKERPEMVDKLKKAVVITSTSHMTVKPPRTQTELKRELHPLRKIIPKSS